ncbi:hypothetical protein ASF44_25095 [Pseudorhodoferax sp. Leaf274]|nr:hypothetical protein ASF44_25095 [Pseudorhodoferax sp. Leaf274]
MLAALPVPALADPAAAPAARYVAMGSSFAAGPGLLPHAADAPARCGRSTRNYAQQLAALRGLPLADVSCSAATTRAVLQPWNELPAQIDALGPATRLVTVTIGGNDVGYVGHLLHASCSALAAQGRVPAGRCRPVEASTDADFAALDGAMRAIAAAVRARAPQAQLVFIDYLTLLPPAHTCAATPLSAAEAERARTVAARLLALTADVAQGTGALLLGAASLSVGHDACAAEPWVQGYPAADKGAPYHPNLAGMSALAQALDRLLPR